VNNNINKLLIHIITITSCEVNNTDTCNIQEIKCDISVKYPEYELMDSSHFIFYDLHTDEYDDSIFTAKISTDPLMYSTDLNNDGYKEYLFYLYKIEPNLRTQIKDDLVYTMKGVIAFSDENGFSYNDSDILSRTGVYRNKNSLILEENAVFLKPGNYRRSYPFSDSTYINSTGLVLYSPLYMAVYEWENSTTFEVTLFHVPRFN